MPCFSSSLPFVTQIWGHIAGAPPPSDRACCGACSCLYYKRFQLICVRPFWGALFASLTDPFGLLAATENPTKLGNSLLFFSRLELHSYLLCTRTVNLTTGVYTVHTYAMLSQWDLGHWMARPFFSVIVGLWITYRALRVRNLTDITVGTPATVAASSLGTPTVYRSNTTAAAAECMNNRLYVNVYVRPSNLTRNKRHAITGEQDTKAI